MNHSTCGHKCEIYSRVCGYYRPVHLWNCGKRQEFEERKTFDSVKDTLTSNNSSTSQETNNGCTRL